jgi:RNA-binding protein YhbY
MSAEELLKMTEKISSAVTDTQAIRDKIFEEFDAASTVDQRGSLLAMFKVGQRKATRRV